MQSLVAGYYSKETGTVKVYADGTMEVELEGKKIRTKISRWLDVMLAAKERRNEKT